MLPNSRERQVLSLAGLLGIVLFALIIVRRKSIPQDQINLLKELQEQVKTQNEIINQQAEKQQKIEQMPWYRQMYNMNISRPVTITTHVSKGGIQYIVYY